MSRIHRVQGIKDIVAKLSASIRGFFKKFARAKTIEVAEEERVTVSVETHKVESLSIEEEQATVEPVLANKAKIIKDEVALYRAEKIRTEKIKEKAGVHRARYEGKAVLHRLVRLKGEAALHRLERLKDEAALHRLERLKDEAALYRAEALKGEEVLSVEIEAPKIDSEVAVGKLRLKKKPEPIIYAKNKGKVIPLHRSLQYKFHKVHKQFEYDKQLKRHEAHQREPTYMQRLEM